MLIELEAAVEQKAVDLKCVCQKKKKVATDETNGEQFLVTVVVDEQFLVTAVVDFYECQYGVVRIG